MAHTAWGEKIDEVLADGEWHELEAVIAAGAAVVPPGKAYRRRELERTRSLTGKGGAPRPLENGAAAAVGARDMARKLLDSRVRRGRVERVGNRVRRLP